MVDRTGQSATSRLARESAIQTSRVQEVEKLVRRMSVRVSELEEVMSYRGEQDEMELENLEGIQMEIRRLRNDVETLLRAGVQGASETEAFRTDADARLRETGQRLERLERSLGLGGGVPLPAPMDGPKETVADEVPVTVPEEAASPAVAAPEAEAGPVGESEPLVLAEQALTDGHPRVARAVLERAMREVEGAGEKPEVLYRYAETWFAEGLYEQAGLRYQNVVDKAGDSSWAAWAMVRQGECFLHLGNVDGARFFWEDVIRQYPDSEASKLAESLLKG
jgi:TolA-binding protein